MFQMEFDFVGEQSEVMAESESARLQMLRFDAIAAMIADRNQPTWMTSRMICGEMAATIKRLQMPVGTLKRRSVHTQLINRMKALRELQRALVKAEARSTREALDLDGGGFKFVFGEILGLFERALLDAGANDLQARSIMLCFDDLLKREPLRESDSFLENLCAKQ
jgi:hypothetical protein